MPWTPGANNGPHPENGQASQPGDPPGSYRDAFGNLRAANGVPIHQDETPTTNPIKTPWGNSGAGGYSNASLSAARGQQAGSASNFAGVGEQGYGAMTAEAQQARDYLRGLASGQNSLSSEQLRQGLQQNLATQRSMAASASPQNSAMAARTAANNMGRANAGMSGQAATAGIQERNAAQQALNQMIMQQRQQDATVAMGSRQNAINAYGGVEPEKDVIEKYGPAFAGGVAAGARLSDERHKTDIRDGESEANRVLKGLRAYTYRYKDERNGKGRQFGPMAQDLEKAGLKHAIIDTPKGKYVDGGKAALSSLALVAAIDRRLEKLEKGKGK